MRLRGKPRSTSTRRDSLPRVQALFTLAVVKRFCSSLRSAPHSSGLATGTMKSRLAAMLLCRQSGWVKAERHWGRAKSSSLLPAHHVLATLMDSIVGEKYSKSKSTKPKFSKSSVPAHDSEPTAPQAFKLEEFFFCCLVPLTRRRDLSLPCTGV